jgi:hypothetical protein
MLLQRTRTLYFIHQPRPSGFEELNRLLEEGVFILVEFKQNKKNGVYYIGKVLRKENNDFAVSFLRRSLKCVNKFIFPLVEDVSLVPEIYIKKILLPPAVYGATKRQNS